MIRNLIAFFFLWVPLQSASMTLHNDSSFPLIAKIYAANGTEEATIPLSPGQSFMWQDSNSPFKTQYDSTTTPYKVQWLCNTGSPYNYNTEKTKKKPPHYESTYASWEGIGPGATITALGSPNGTKTCVVKKGKRSAQKNQTNSSTNAGANNWSNDGGQSWTNDGGPGWQQQGEDPFNSMTDESQFKND